MNHPRRRRMESCATTWMLTRAAGGRGSTPSPSPSLPADLPPGDYRADWSQPSWACGQGSAFADLRVSAKADTRHKVPREGDFNRLNSYW